MFRLPLVALVLSLCIGCAYPGMYQAMHSETYQPKLEKTGGPEILYMLPSDQLKNYFPTGISRNNILQKYGAPAATGTAIDKDGQPTTTVTYVYTRTYSHMNTDFQMLMVIGSSSVSLTFDGADKLIAANLASNSIYQDHNGQQRAPSDAELTQYLGPAPAAIIAPAQLTTTTTPAALRLGIQVAALTPAQTAAAGVKSGGAFIQAVEPDGLAATKGLLPGDIVVKLNGSDILGQADLVEKIRTRAASDELVLQVLTNGKTRAVTIQSANAAGATAL